ITNAKSYILPFLSSTIYTKLDELTLLYNGDTSKALKRQNHKCGKCGLKMLGDEKVNLHHVDENHSNSKINNLLAVHESCHDYLHMSKGASQEHREPDAGKRDVQSRI
ncbi:HNH endonuclease signature motif containing protein, partial [Microcoleus sp. K4-B3]